jgi:hypothetical protein
MLQSLVPLEILKNFQSILKFFADEFNADLAMAGEHFAGALGCVMHVSCSSKRDK